MWVALGQRLGDLVPWVSHVLSVTAGYSGAMAIEPPGRGLDYVVALALLATLVVLRWREPVAGTRATWPLVAWTGFMAFKHGFVRHDGGHVSLFYLWAMAVLLALHSTEAKQVVRAGRAVAGLALASITMPALTGGFLVETVTTPVHLGMTVNRLLDSTSRDAEYRDIRASLRKDFAIDSTTLRLVRGGGVQVDPWDAEAAWAYQLAWQPVPVFQHYSAYTASLDQLNAQALAQRGPQFILHRRVAAIDGRIAAFEDPRYTLQVLCRYRQVRATDQWLTLARGTDRCGAPRPLGTLAVQGTHSIRVPHAPAGEMTYMSVDAPTPVLTTIVTALYKPLNHPGVSLDGAAPGRLIRDTMDGPLILALPRDRAGMPDIFRDASTRTVSFRNLPQGAVVHFYSMPVGP